MGKGVAQVDTVVLANVPALVDRVDIEVQEIVRGSTEASTREFAPAGTASSFSPGVDVSVPLYCFPEDPGTSKMVSRG